MPLAPILTGCQGLGRRLLAHPALLTKGTVLEPPLTPGVEGIQAAVVRSISIDLEPLHAFGRGCHGCGSPDRLAVNRHVTAVDTDAALVDLTTEEDGKSSGLLRVAATPG